MTATQEKQPHPPTDGGDAENINHLNKCKDVACELCDYLLEFYTGCDKCKSFGHKDVPCKHDEVM